MVRNRIAGICTATAMYANALSMSNAATFSVLKDVRERILAKLPKMTANILGPVCIFVYLLVLDWRMALLALVSIPVGMLFMMTIMKNYGTQYKGAVKTTQHMNETIVEYV